MCLISLHFSLFPWFWDTTQGSISRQSREGLWNQTVWICVWYMSLLCHTLTRRPWANPSSHRHQWPYRWNQDTNSNCCKRRLAGVEPGVGAHWVLAVHYYQRQGEWAECLPRALEPWKPSETFGKDADKPEGHDKGSPRSEWPRVEVSTVGRLQSKEAKLPWQEAFISEQMSRRSLFRHPGYF